MTKILSKPPVMLFALGIAMACTITPASGQMQVPISNSADIEPASSAKFGFPHEPLSLGDTTESPSDAKETGESTEDEAAGDAKADPSENSSAALATKLANPVGDLWVIVNQYNVNEIHGKAFDGSKWQNNLNVQPVLPLHLTDKWNLINRPVIPLYFDSPYPKLNRGSIQTDRACGIGDITFVSLLSPRQPAKVGCGHFVWGAGPTLIFPTASPGVLGQHQYQAGPAAVALYTDEKWVFGALGQQWWSYAEKGSGHEHTNQLSLQYFVWYQFCPGWQVGTAPIATVDWTKSCNEGFTLPIGLGIQHVFKVGKLPLKLGFEYEYAVVHPDNDLGVRSIFRITVAPVLPALMKGNILP